MSFDAKDDFASVVGSAPCWAPPRRVIPLRPGPLPPSSQGNPAGVASLILGMVGTIAAAALLVLAADPRMQSVGPEGAGAFLFGLGLIVDATLLVLGTVLAIVGMVGTSRDKVSAVVGLVVSAMPLLMVALVLMLVQLRLM